MKEIDTKGQGISMSGVGAHNHNGGAELSIQKVVYKSFSMVIHPDLRWPEVSSEDLWSLALN